MGVDVALILHGPQTIGNGPMVLSEGSNLRRVTGRLPPLWTGRNWLGKECEETTFGQHFGCVINLREWQPRPLGNVQQGVFPVSKVQNPEPRVDLSSNRLTTGRATQGPLAQLGLTKRAEIAIAAVVFKNIHCGYANTKRFRQLRRLNELQVIRGSVILRKGRPNTPHQAPDRQVKSRRAVLPLIVAIRRKLENLMCFDFMFQDVHHRMVDLGISTPAFFVMKSALIPDAGQHQAVVDASGPIAIPRQPGNRSNRPRYEQEAIGIMQFLAGENVSQGRSY